MELASTKLHLPFLFWGVFLKVFYATGLSVLFDEEA